jgi:hypothetical protein
MLIVITMASPTIMVAPMAVIVTLVVPVSFVALPAFTIVVVVRMNPVCPFKRGALPMSPDPLVTMTGRYPISLYPDEPRAWRWYLLFINDRRWRGPDVHGNLR